MSYFLKAALNLSSNGFRSHCFPSLQQSLENFRSLKEVFTGRFTIASRSKAAGIRWNSTNIYDLNTNVAKDVILFKYENPRFYKLLNIFAISQLCFWSYLSHFSFTTLKDAPVDYSRFDELAWYQRINLGENKYRNGITVCCFLIGYGIFCAAWTFTLRSVRYLILHKGGRNVSFVTYGPFGKNRIMTVPLNHISAQEAREAANVQLPLKIQNRALFYILDMRGEFKNPALFDQTAGLKRKLK